MRASFDDKVFLKTAFYSLWVLALALQAYLVELRGDEAYYWRQSLELAWGYFDHPPVTPFLIKVGYLFFQNELGVRLLFIVLITATVWVMEKLVNPFDLKLFYSAVMSLAFLQIGMVFGGGMFAIPDFPLLFFTAVFFLLYKRYLQDSSSWWLVLLLSITISLLLLSKYHGILVVGFTVLSNFKLLTKRSFWILVASSTILLLPHFYWQLANDFPSTRFHLFERSSKPYSISYTLEYLAALPFIVGPLIGILLIYIGIVFRPQDTFEKSLKFLIIGTYVFFFLMTFKGSVEGNWTIIALIPLLYIGYQQIEKSEKLKKIAFYSFVFSFPLIVLIRACLMWNPLPSLYNFENHFGAKRWSQELKEKTNGLPVAMMNSYQNAALYEFYSGIPAFSLNNSMYRKNQYTIWDTEAKFQGKSTVVVANYTLPNADSIRILNESFSFVTVDNFRAASNLQIQSNLQSPVKCKAGDTLDIQIRFAYKNNNVRDVEANPDFPSRIIYSFFQSPIPIETVSDFFVKNEMVNNNKYYNTSIIVPPTPGPCDFYISIGTGWLPPSINSEKVRFIVE
jgi:hypothetical protein